MDRLEEARRCIRRAEGLREQLHRRPQLGHREVETTRLIRETLRNCGVEVLELGLKTGAVGRIVGGRPGRGKLLALREDIDALPIQEETELPFASQVPGVSHACGHDIHTAALLGCAELLSRRREELRGEVLLLFQCGEETFDGAAEMLDHGVFRPRTPDALVGFHCAPELPVGTVGIRRGISSASCDVITIRVRGRGGHGAHPEGCVDPVVIGAGLLTQLQTVISRENRATDPAVLTFGEFRGGTAPNVIPDEAVLRGTLRTYSGTVRRHHLGAVERITQSFCAAFGAKGTVTVEKGMPPLVNDLELCRALEASVERALGPGHVAEGLAPSMGSDDFSCLLEACGGHGVQYQLGTALEEVPNSALGLHAAKNVFPSQALEPGILTLAQFALDYLA